jgi:hypothetical protein
MGGKPKIEKTPSIHFFFSVNEEMKFIIQLLAAKHLCLALGLMLRPADLRD